VTTLQHSRPHRISALLKQRCPRCLEGSIFRGWITTRDACPVCEFRYGREEGYFSGGMDLSFFLAAPLLAFIFLVLTQIFVSFTLLANLFISYAIFLPSAPLLFRYSRVLWLYLDWQLDPVHDVKPAPPPPIEARAWLMPPPRQPWTHDSLFTLAQRLAALIDPAFERTLPRHEIEPDAALGAAIERAAWGTARFGLMGERALPLPGETFRRHSAFSAYGLTRDQALALIQEYDLDTRTTRVIIQARTTPDVLARIDRILVDTYTAAPIEISTPTA
jgi:uncharacterized protein (DUF983 family)